MDTYNITLFWLYLILQQSCKSLKKKKKIISNNITVRDQSVNSRNGEERERVKNSVSNCQHSQQSTLTLPPHTLYTNTNTQSLSPPKTNKQRKKNQTEKKKKEKKRKLRNTSINYRRISDYSRFSLPLLRFLFVILIYISSFWLLSCLVSINFGDITIFEFVCF